MVARKPLTEGTVAANVLKHSTGALNIDAGRVEVAADDRQSYGVNGDEGSPTLGVYGNRERVAYARSDKGRWPANLAHDGSDEVEAAFARFNAPGQAAPGRGTEPSAKTKDVFGAFSDSNPFEPRGDTGSAARFFFSGKAQAWERPVADNGERHATVKPVALMEWLVSLVAPPGGLVLDPFCGTGSTLAACDRLGIE